jgi:hypothetical protein
MESKGRIETNQTGASDRIRELAVTRQDCDSSGSNYEERFYRTI